MNWHLFDEVEFDSCENPYTLGLKWKVCVQLRVGQFHKEGSQFTGDGIEEAGSLFGRGGARVAGPRVFGVGIPAARRAGPASLHASEAEFRGGVSAGGVHVDQLRAEMENHAGLHVVRMIASSGK